MTQAISKLMRLVDEFLEGKRENRHYRILIKSVIVEMLNPTGKHSAIAGFQAIELGFLRDQVSQLSLPLSEGMYN